MTVEGFEFAVILREAPNTRCIVTKRENAESLKGPREDSRSGDPSRLKLR